MGNYPMGDVEELDPALKKKQNRGKYEEKNNNTKTQCNY